LRWGRRWERWIVAGLILLAIGSVVGLLLTFYRQSTVLVPADGGTYIEGSVGAMQPLNPWFTIQNDVNRDIVSLVFAGLMRYDPDTRRVEEDLATMQVGGAGRLYTLTLKDNIFWHDSTKESPHPVTVDDVLFTFQTVQDPQFPNPLLRQNFEGVTVEKVNAKTVEFRLEKPYSFFPSNLTLGLLPKRAFEGIPISRLDQAVDFGFAPIGAGPYQLKTVLQTELSTEITLERFDRPVPPHSRLRRIIFRIFPDYYSLLSDLRNLHGIRTVPRSENGDPAVPRRFTAGQYTLPQYVALFFNLDRSVLQDQKLRLGLQLGINKQALVDGIHESVVADTPLLELNPDDWRLAYNPDAAQGALFESEWYFPEKLRLQRLLEREDANRTGDLRFTAPIALLNTGAVLTLTGSLTRESLSKSINGVALRLHPTLSGAWIVQLPTEGGTGTLVPGDNLVRLTDAKGNILDSFYVFRATDPNVFRKALDERQLVRQFLATRAGSATNDRVTAGDMKLDQGFLRRRVASDPIGVRENAAGRSLTLTLLTSPSPPQYQTLAKAVAEQWQALGVRMEVQVPPTRQDFEERMLKRDYDVLLFGQSLLDNLDSEPYWHSRGIQRLTGKRSDLRLDAYNLSQYASFEADTQLEIIRETTDDAERLRALTRLQEVFSRDIPAIILYSPLYTFAHTEAIQGISLRDLSLHSDRFLTLDHWFTRQERVFEKGKGWLSFFPWLLYGVPDTPPADGATPVEAAE
jgi:ABC-type transport system substrate-binding protein